MNQEIVHAAQHTTIDGNFAALRICASRIGNAVSRDNPGAKYHLALLDDIVSVIQLQVAAKAEARGPSWSLSRLRKGMDAYFGRHRTLYLLVLTVAFLSSGFMLGLMVR